MGFEDFFENNRHHRGSYRGQSYHSHENHHGDSHHSYTSHHGHESHFDWMKILYKIKDSKKLKILLLLAAILILAIAILLIIIFLPLLGKTFSFITQLDTKGLLDYITSIIDKFLKG